MSPIGFLLKFSIKRWNNDVVGHLVFFHHFFTIFSKNVITTYWNIKTLEKTFTKNDEIYHFLTKKCLNQIFHWEFTNREKKTKNPSYRILIKSQFCVEYFFPGFSKKIRSQCHHDFFILSKWPDIPGFLINQAFSTAFNYF